METPFSYPTLLGEKRSTFSPLASLMTFDLLGQDYIHLRDDALDTIQLGDGSYVEGDNY